MNVLQALVLGIVQGLTEFFPISSSAHLKLMKWFMGVEGDLIYFDLTCHAGTLFALIYYLRKDVWEVLRSVKLMGLYFLALLPLVPGYFLLKGIRTAASDPQYLGYCLMATAALLFLASKKKESLAYAPSLSADRSQPLPLSGKRSFASLLGDVLCIGVMQTMALIPGISRSGSTIAAARFCGWTWPQAARFSFLLAIPTILGGELLETIKILKGGEMEAVSLSCYATGFAASLGFGLVAVRFVFWIYENRSVRPFAWYCLGMGLFAWVIFRG